MGAAEPISGPGVVERGAETILLVEDEDGLRNLVRKVLTRQGYQVIETRAGQEALQASQSHSGPIHLLLTDVVLPRMGGSELAEKLRALRPDTKVLFMSGYNDDAIQGHGVLNKGIAFLQKPFTPTILFQKVREVLDGDTAKVVQNP